MLKIELKPPYDKEYRWGYVSVEKRSGRRVIALYQDEKTRAGMSYVRYLMAVKLGRKLTKDEGVDYLDGDKTNDDPENLTIIPIAEWRKKWTGNRNKWDKYVWFDTDEEFLKAIEVEFGVTDAKVVPGYEGYAITPKGRVFSCRKWNNDKSDGVRVREIHPSYKPTIGRVTVSLTVGNQFRSLYLSRVLGITHLPSPRPDQFLIRHLNDDKLDDRLENLAWGSDQENKDDAVRNGKVRHGEDHGNAVLTNVEAVEIVRLRTEEGMTYAKIAERLSVSQFVVYNVCRGKSYAKVTGVKSE